jgi:CHAT domain-containing protein/tetratricopeptide (TPR) repeat protein
LDAARTKARNACVLFTGDGASDALWRQRFGYLQTELLLKQNHPDRALSLLDQLASQRAWVTPESREDLETKRLLLRSQAHYYLGQAAQSDSELGEAHARAVATHSALLGEVLWAEGIVQLDAGHWDEAAARFERSLELASARAPDEGARTLLEASDLVNIAEIDLLSAHYDRALRSADSAVRFAQTGEARKQLQSALGKRGWAYLNLGEFELALADFLRAEHAAQEIGLTVSRIGWLENAGFAAYKLGRTDDARRYDEAALAEAGKLSGSGPSDQIVTIECNLALLLYTEGDYGMAKSYSDRAAEHAKHVKDDKAVAYAIFLQGLVTEQTGTEQDSQALLDTAWHLTPDAETRMEIESAFGRLYARHQDASHAESWFRRSIETFEQNRAAIHEEVMRLSSFAYGDSVYRDYAEFLIEAGRSVEALDLLDRSRSRSLEEGLGIDTARVAAADPRNVAAQVGGTILFYSLGRRQSYLWAVTARHIELHRLPPQSEIESWVAAHRHAIERSTDLMAMTEPAATALYEALIKPASRDVGLGAKVYVVPDGVLHSLNFESLLAPSARGPQYWIEQVTITMAGALHFLARAGPVREEASSRDLLVIGDPVSAGEDFGALPNASSEIAHVSSHFASDRRTVITGAQAIPAAYVATGPERYRYVHFVAHGIANRQTPLESAVILSPAADSKEYKLYAREVLGHRLHARLVTISACNGSGLRTYAGEGLVGLAWAFLRAGSHNVIAALWPVDDAATALLMDSLYAGLAAGQPPAEALRAAKLTLLHSAGVYRKPLYWAAFQLYAGA